VTAVILDPVHRGPSRSGNGGWTAGVLAAHAAQAPPARAPAEAAEPEAVQVTLRRPPPIGRPLQVRRDGEHVELLDDDRLVAEADPAEAPGPVDPVGFAAASSAEAAYAGLVSHPFPDCFVCGTEPADGVGLRLRPGRVAAGRTACTWIPHPHHVSAPHVWAALDCPGGWTLDIAGRPMVLGRMTAVVRRLPSPRERLVVVGAFVDTQGRKSRTATTVYDAEGREVGSAGHTWIQVDALAFN
jgi:hypothetical protein